MTQANPLGSPRLKTVVSRKGYQMDDATAEFVLVKLSEILVDQTGMAKGISLETDPQTGDKIFQFQLSRDSQLPERLIAREIKGVPLHFVAVD